MCGVSCTCSFTLLEMDFLQISVLLELFEEPEKGRHTSGCFFPNLSWSSNSFLQTWQYTRVWEEDGESCQKTKLSKFEVHFHFEIFPSPLLPSPTSPHLGLFLLLLLFNPGMLYCSLFKNKSIIFKILNQ